MILSFLLPLLWLSARQGPFVCLCETIWCDFFHFCKLFVNLRLFRVLPIDIAACLEYIFSSR
jgi:hypothetical protein